MESGFNLPVVVNVRIEGTQKTIFEGSVQTRGHDVTIDSGTYRADGTNGNENPFPSPTCTAALDDAAIQHNFSWNGTYYPSFDDILVTRIGGEAAGDGTFWQLIHNFKRANIGGGQLQIGSGDSVLWALIPTTPPRGLPPLKLKGSRSALVNQEIIVTVIDGETRTGVQGATIRGQATDQNGQARITFTTIGTEFLKAEHRNYVRSNVLRISAVDMFSWELVDGD